MITGRTVQHLHTRTKTGRAPEMNAAAPGVRAEISPPGAAAQGPVHGDLVQVITPARGAPGPAADRGDPRRRGVRPLHYGYGGLPEARRPRDGLPGRAAHETTITDRSPHSEMLARTAQATRDRALLDLTSDCHPRDPAADALDQHDDQGAVAAAPRERPTCPGKVSRRACATIRAPLSSVSSPRDVGRRRAAAGPTGTPGRRAPWTTTTTSAPTDGPCRRPLPRRNSGSTAG
ncbi:molybdopterin dinucleotide binding domain-containing protein [Streptomyces sp. MN3]